MPADMISSLVQQENRALLSPEILTLVRDLVRKERTFEPNLEGLMAIRRQKQSQIYMNLLEKKQAMSFPAETKYVHSRSSIHFHRVHAEGYGSLDHVSV